jgi:class 3 adenylate cyclase
MSLKKDIFYNIVFITIISIYCIEVCPHVSKLGLRVTGTSFLVVLLPLFILRIRISKSTRNSKKIFLTNLTYFLVAGTIVGLFNYLYRSFPIESALKMITGAICLGVLNSIIYALEEPFIKTKERISFINRTSFFLALILLLIGVVWILLIKQNLTLFDAVQNGSMINLVSSVVIETSFVITILIIYFLRIIHLYKKTFRIGINGQILSLQEVRKDNLNVTLPRFSNDEFSIIGDEVNQMINRLKQGEKIKEGFQKVTGKNIGTDLIDRISKNDFTSEQKEMTVLFTDIKGFTKLCETSDPKQFVMDLNNHFELMVQAINELDGTVNKFIGDAILVYFEGENSCARAVETSLKMISNSNFDIGVGISHGTLLAGLIGCEARLEYSIIGSVVNKAARLESATRTLNSDIVICESTALNLLAKNFKKFEKKEIQLKGFEKKQTVYSRCL